MSLYYNEYAFESKLASCLKEVKLILNHEKAGLLSSANDISHRYEDKYLLAEQLTNCAGAAFWNVLLTLGLTETQFRDLKQWAEKQAVSLQLEVSTHCAFMKETEREEESAQRVEVERTGILREKITSKVVTKIKEFHYNYQVQYRVKAYAGTGRATDSTLTIIHRSTQHMCILREKRSPYPESSFFTHDVDISWLLSVVEKEQPVLTFRIDRSAEDCYTPRRNSDIEKALDCTYRLHSSLGRESVFILSA